MATGIVATRIGPESIQIPIDDFEIATELLLEAAALQEMAGRVKECNTEDFGMIQRASDVTFRLINEACLALRRRA